MKPFVGTLMLPHTEHRVYAEEDEEVKTRYRPGWKRSQR
jgi:hypothetical protein